MLSSDGYGSIDSGYMWSFYEAMMEKELKKLRHTKCPVCNRLNFYRLSSLGEGELHCKSCKTKITVERSKQLRQVGSKSA